MGGPRICGDFVFSPAGVAAGLGVHFEKDEIGEAAFAKTPGRTEAGDSTADNHDGDFFDALGGEKAGTVAQQMAHLERIVDERAFDLLFAFEGEANERRAAKPEKFTTAQLQ